MADDSTVTYQISVSELDKLDLCQRALDGLTKASQMTKANRQSVRNAVGDTCELIDSPLIVHKEIIGNHPPHHLRQSPTHQYQIFFANRMCRASTTARFAFWSVGFNVRWTAR